MTRLVATVQEAVERIQAAFWRRYEANAKLREALEGKDRVIQIEITDGPSYHLEVRDGRIRAAREGLAEGPDVQVRASTADFLAVINGELNPVTAYLSRRVVVKAPMRDLMLVKAFLGG